MVSRNNGAWFHATPRRVLYQGPPGSPTGTLYEEVGEVALVQNPPMTAYPSQQEGGSQPGSSGRTPEKTRSSQARRKSIGSVRTGRGQSPVPRTSDRSRTPNKARTPLRRQNPDQEATPDRGKSHAHSATPIFPADCQMREPLPTPPSFKHPSPGDGVENHMYCLFPKIDFFTPQGVHVILNYFVY